MLIYHLLKFFWKYYYWKGSKLIYVQVLVTWSRKLHETIKFMNVQKVQRTQNKSILNRVYMLNCWSWINYKCMSYFLSSVYCTVNRSQSRTIKKTVLRSNSASGRRSLNFLYSPIAQFIRWLGEEYRVFQSYFFRHLSSFCFTITINTCEIEHVIDKSFWFVIYYVYNTLIISQKE